MFEVPAQAPVDLGEYLRIIRRRAWVVAVVTVLTMAVAYAWAATRDKIYTATGQIVVAQDTQKSGAVATQSQVVQSSAVHDLALRHFRDAAWVSATFDGESGSVTLRAESTDPSLAAKSIDAQVVAYKEFLTDAAAGRLQALNGRINSLQERIDVLNQEARRQPTPSPSITNELSSSISVINALRAQLPQLQVDVALADPNVEILRGGQPPTSASSITEWHAVLIGLGVGLLLGVLAALLLEFLDDSIRTRQDLLRISGSDVPVLGTIPPARSRAGTVVVLERPASPAAEAYRSLRTAVQFAVADRTRCIAVTTARTRKGKTETACNLAVLTAQMGQRTVLVDCDMRLPHVHEVFGIPNDAGFTSVVTGESESDSLKRIAGNDRLFVLPTGPVPPNPAELLASPRSHEVLAGLHAKKKSSRRRARVTEQLVDDLVHNTLVIVDTPPLLLATDAVALAPALGGILLVVTARTTRRKELRKALELLRQVDAPLLGMVLHSADSAETVGFGEERSRRERRHTDRQRAPNGASAAEPGYTVAEPAHAITEPAHTITEPAHTITEPAHTIVRWVPPNGASAEDG